MKASRATVRQTKALARVEAKLDRVLELLGDVPQPEPAEAEVVVEEIAGEEPEAEEKPKDKKR